MARRPDPLRFLFRKPVSLKAESILRSARLGMTNGDEVEVSAEGDDEEAALDGVVGFLLGDK